MQTLRQVPQIQQRLANVSTQAQSSIIGCHERPLNGLERFYYEVAKQGENDTITGYRLDLARDLPDLATLEKHLVHLQNKLPSLKTRISQKDGKTVFVEPKYTPKLEITEQNVSTKDAWKHIMSQALQAPFNPEIEPLVKFVVLRPAPAKVDCGEKVSQQQCQLLAITHHSLIDGDGMLYIYKSLFDFIDKVSAEKPSEQSTIDHINDLVPQTLKSCGVRLESYSLKPPGLNYLGQSLIIDFIAKKIFPLFHPHVLDANNNFADVAFNHTQTTQLLHAAKAHGVSLYGLISAAAIQVAPTFFPSTPFGQLVTTTTPVSLRQRLDVPPIEDELGCFVSLVRDGFYRSPKDLKPMSKTQSRQQFWSIAQQAQQQLRQKVSNKDHEAIPFLLNHLFSKTDDASIVTKAVLPDTFLINNLGRQTLDIKGLKWFSWMSCAGAVAPGVALNFATVNGKLQLGLFSRRLDKDTLDQFRQCLEEKIAQAMTPAS